jgi:hypothetical protein
MYKGNLITKEMKGFLIPKGSRPGKVQGNPKMHKKNNPCRVIINGNKHSTENMAEIVENELAENVRNLNSVPLSFNSLLTSFSYSDLFKITIPDDLSLGLITIDSSYNNSFKAFPPWFVILQGNYVAKFGKDLIYRTKVIVRKPVWTPASRPPPAIPNHILRPISRRAYKNC